MHFKPNVILQISLITYIFFVPLTAIASPFFATAATTVTTANPAPDEFVSASGIEMILISPGTFLMGSPPTEPGRDENERQHQVTLSNSFWLGKTEVTQNQWQKVMGNNPAKLKGDNLPVEQVSWHECISFCNTLSELEGLTPAYQISGENVTWLPSADGYRLPTEAEWEYACRAGTTGPHAGNVAEMARYSANSGRKTRAVGTGKPNVWGLFDMHGNVWEWCWDMYQKDYGPGPDLDPTGSDTDNYRIERGGSWHRNARDCRSASRGTDNPHARRNGLGFRLAR